MSVRGNILELANNLTHGERNQNYGDPVDNMDNFAMLLNGYLLARGVDNEFTLDAEDAAWIMVLAKMARTVERRGYHADNYVDAAAYAAIAAECADEREDMTRPFTVTDGPEKSDGYEEAFLKPSNPPEPGTVDWESTE